jgi:hypothetical protein
VTKLYSKHEINGFLCSGEFVKCIKWNEGYNKNLKLQYELFDIDFWVGASVCESPSIKRLNVLYGKPLIGHGLLMKTWLGVSVHSNLQHLFYFNVFQLIMSYFL